MFTPDLKGGGGGEVNDREKLLKNGEMGDGDKGEMQKALSNEKEKDIVPQNQYCKR